MGSEKTRRFTVDEDGTFGVVDALLDEVNPMGVESKVVKSFEQVIPIKPIKSLGDIQLKA